MTKDFPDGADPIGWIVLAFVDVRLALNVSQKVVAQLTEKDRSNPSRSFQFFRCLGNPIGGLRDMALTQPPQGSRLRDVFDCSGAIETKDFLTELSIKPETRVPIPLGSSSH